MDLRGSLSVLALFLLVVAVVGCGVSRKDPVASPECLVAMEQVAVLTGSSTEKLDPAREKHFEDWEFGETLIFLEWIDSSEDAGVDFGDIDVCDPFFDSWFEWWDSEDGQDYKRRIEEWGKSDEGREFVEENFERNIFP